MFLNTAPVSDSGERHYRFSVKCDRAFNRKLVAAASRAGVSVNTFVQQHFDRILEPRVAAPAFDAKKFNPLDFARMHCVSVTVALVWLEMRKRADRSRELRISVHDLAVAIGTTADIARKAILTLRENDLVEQIGGAGSKEGSKYRVGGEG